MFDFRTVSSEYPSKQGRWAFNQAAITRRGLDCRQWLKGRPEKVIAVVSHSGFLRVGVSHRRYANADYRIFDFAQDGSDELVEWATTAQGGMMWSEPGTAGIEAGDFQHERTPEVAETAKVPGEVVAEAPT